VFDLSVWCLFTGRWGLPTFRRYQLVNMCFSRGGLGRRQHQSCTVAPPTQLLMPCRGAGKPERSLGGFFFKVLFRRPKIGAGARRTQVWSVYVPSFLWSPGWCPGALDKAPKVSGQCVHQQGLWAIAVGKHRLAPGIPVAFFGKITHIQSWDTRRSREGRPVDRPGGGLEAL